jgi:hypothetical protein
MRKHMTIHEFLHGEEKSFYQKAKSHIKKNKSFYLSIAGTTVIFLFCGMNGSVEAAGEIDAKARGIYYKLAEIGKWIIVCKGAIDIIQTASQGDFDAVKGKFIKYLMVFICLLGLPWAMDEVESLFKANPASGIGK